MVRADVCAMPGVGGSAYAASASSKRERKFPAVTGEMPVVVVDHRDARAHEARDREHGDAGAQREGGVGVAQVVEMARG
jgi:hypothetical protein